MSRHRPTASTIALLLALAASCSLASPVEAQSWRADPTYAAWKANSAVAEKNAEAVEFLLERQARDCADFPHEGDTPFVTIGAENLLDMKITPEGDVATLVSEGMHCSAGGGIWTGSAGSVNYLVVEGRIFTTGLTHPPFTVEHTGRIHIIVPQHGASCESSEEGFKPSGHQVCFPSMTWDFGYQMFIGKVNLFGEMGYDDFH